ncbi:MAG: diguanylate cyclase [Thiohalorhabdus sp.]
MPLADPQHPEPASRPPRHGPTPTRTGQASEPPARTWGRKVLIAAVLAALTLGGNAGNIPLFFGVDYLFGSIAALLAAAWIGPVAGALVAAVGGLYTLELWGHPWALVVFTLEAGAVGLLRRRFPNLILADLAFWVAVGVPLLLVLYMGVMGMPAPQAGLIALKQPVNGLFNAALASGATLLLASRHWAPPLREVLFTLLFGGMLLPGLALIAFQAAQLRGEQHRLYDQLLATALTAVTERLDPVRAKTSLAASLPETVGELGIALADEDGEWITRVDTPAWLDRAERRRLSPRLLALLPPADARAPTMARWEEAYFSTESILPGGEGKRILLMHPAREAVLGLARANLRGHVALALLALTGLLIAAVLARRISLPFEELRRVTRNLPERLRKGEKPVLPAGPVAELDGLNRSFTAMGRSLAASFRELEAERQNLEEKVRQRTRELERLATHDYLTGIPNRAKIYEWLEVAHEEFRRYGTPFAVVMFDIDHFKAVNDRFGHPTGDAVLRELTLRVEDTLREADALGRWGGEEFLILARHTDCAGARKLADRVQQAVAVEAFRQVGEVTISLGVAEIRPGESLEHLLERADHALYAAKGNGRNRVVLYRETLQGDR